MRVIGWVAGQNGAQPTVAAFPTSQTTSPKHEQNIPRRGPTKETSLSRMPSGDYRGERLIDIPTCVLQQVLLLPTRKAGYQERLEMAIADELAARRFRKAA